MASPRRPVVACLLAVVTVAVVVLLAPAASAGAAQDAGERIVDYAVDLRIEDSGVLAVREEIVYDFGSNQRHGILRDIPVRLHYDDRYDRVYPLSVVSVETSPGAPGQYRVEDAGANKRIRVGDPDRTITGMHTYILSYRVEAALNGFADHDELYWVAIGTHWGVPIERATVAVGAPAAITQIACFAGPDRSVLPCAESGTDGSSARFSHAGLSAFEGVTVVAAIPTGVVPRPAPRLDERWSLARAFSVTPGTVGGAGALLALVVGGFAALVWNAGRDRRYEGSPVDVAFGGEGDAERPVSMLERPATPVEFAPPDGVRPGQVGTLVDEQANPLDVVATLVDLAVRGHLRIEEIPKKGWFGKPDWTIVRLERDTEGLLPYEGLLLEGLFRKASGGTVKLSELRNTFAARLRQVQDSLYADAVRQKWFPVRPDKVRTRWRAIGVAVLVAGIALVVLAAARTHAALVPVPIALGGVLLVAGSRWMPRRTARGTAVLRRVMGFRRFIEESEADRARFAERQNLFSEYLPYAVVFGCTEKWAKAFAGLDGELPEMSWYGGVHPFTVSSFSSSMDGFAVTTAGTISSVPASTPGGSGSSGFGGGGFSGGGGGGGGGGSW